MAHPLTAARKRAKLSQQALAELIGRTRATVLRIEKAQTKPPLETVSKIITALREKNVEMSADDFLQGATNDGSAASFKEASAA